MPAVVLSLLAEKGGVGRTTLSINLSAALAEKKQKVLLIDTDAQGSASQHFLSPSVVEALPVCKTVAAVFDDRLEPDPEQMIHQTSVKNLYLLPASDSLKDFNHARPQTSGALQFGLRDLLQGELRSRFDWIIIDTPPDISNLPAWSTLLASDYVITPVEPETFSSQALVGVERQVELAVRCGNAGLVFLGYVVNKRKRVAFHAAHEKALRQIYGPRVFTTAIKDLVAYVEAQGLQKPVVTYASRSDAATLVRQLAEELSRRIATLRNETSSKKAA